MFWQLLVLQVGFFVLLVLVLQKFFHGHLTRGIKSVEKLQQQNLKREEEVKRTQEATLRDCQARIHKVDEDIRAKLAAVEEEARQVKKSILTRAEEEHQAMLEEVKGKEKVLEQRFERETKQKGSAIAMELVKSAFGSSMLLYLHTQLVDELLSEILFSLSKSGSKVRNSGKARVVSAFPLSEKQREIIKAKLWNDKTPQTCELVEETDKNLIAGLVIYLDEVVLDGSLKNCFHRKLGIS